MMAVAFARPAVAVCLLLSLLSPGAAQAPPPARLRASSRRAAAAATSDTSRAAVYARADQVGHSAAAEMLRFVTAYGTGMEALVDVTPYAPLLESAADSAGNLRFYTFIDTWVGNSSGWDVLYMDNETGQCYPTRRSHGNGWSVSLDLVLWPEAPGPTPSTRPRESIALGTGYFGGRYTAGVVDMHEGKIHFGAAGHSRDMAEPWLELPQPADLLATGTPGGEALAAPPQVLRCDRGATGAKLAALLGHGARKAQKLQLEHEAGENKDAEFEDVRGSMQQTLAWPYMMEVQILEVREEERVVVASYNASEMAIQRGMPVYIRSSDVYTDQLLYGTLWWNLTYPFKPAGEVAAVGNESMTLKMIHPCLPSNATKQLPRFLVPATPDLLPEADALAEAAVGYGRRSAGDGAAGALEEPLLLEPVGGWDRWYAATSPATSGDGRGGGAVVVRPLPVVARVRAPIREGEDQDASALAWQGRRPQDNATVCVVTQRRQGNLFKRNFDVRQLRSGDRVLVQLAVTGHGWASTTSNCGEFCHAVYRIAINGESAANVTQWRDDCGDNPIDGSVQRGTWSGSRNGWCPGSVEPGLYFDATEWIRRGENDLRFDLDVWSSSAEKYEPYTDVGGFTFGDQAFFDVGLSLFVYSGEVVDAVRALGNASTAAEAALRDGCSHPDALQPPTRPRRLSADAPEPILEAGDGALVDTTEALPVEALSLQEDRPEADGAGDSDGVFDFEARAPWYLYNETAEGPPGAAAGARRLRIFDGALVQAATRVVEATVSRSSLPSAWARAALHLRLSKPPDGLKYDRWDRAGSVGMQLTPNGQDAELHLLSLQAEVSSSWSLLPP